MTICNGSYPASQGEHLLAHYIEMMRPPWLPHSFHGEHVAVCAVAMAGLQEQLLARDAPPVLHPTAPVRDDLVRHFGPAIGDACWREFELKRQDAGQTAALNARLVRDWDAIRARIGKIAITRSRLSGLLVAAGAPVDPAALGWPAELFEHARHHAREIRNRYTFLDLDADSR